MNQSPNLAAMLAIAGGLAAATLPSAANASCSTSGGPSAGRAASGTLAGSDGEPQYDVSLELQNGTEAMAKSDYAFAKKSFDHAVSVSPNDPSLLYLAGSARMGLSDWKGARKMLEKSLKNYPKFIRAKQDLGVTYAKLGEMAKAQAMLDDLRAAEKTCAGACTESHDLQVAVSTISAAMTGPVALR